MNNKFPKKPHTVIEGLTPKFHVSKNFNNFSSIKSNKDIILYAGATHKRYGIQNMIEWFIQGGFSNAELHIYGKGDLTPYLKNISLKNESIKYYGWVNLEEVHEAEKRASFLINPRNPNEKFSLYSFPSKLIEYMVTGVPVITTRMPFLPKEYSENLIIIESFSKESFIETFKKVLNMSKKTTNFVPQAAQGTPCKTANKNFSSTQREGKYRLSFFGTFFLY
jgi:glycosyltransferase involved in cell wall biosynthesis